MEKENTVMRNCVEKGDILSWCYGTLFNCELNVLASAHLKREAEKRR